MRRISTRSIITVCLIVASIGSYTFLSLMANPSGPNSTSIEVEMIQEEQNELFLPDVQLVKKILEVTQKISTLSR